MSPQTTETSTAEASPNAPAGQDGAGESRVELARRLLLWVFASYWVALFVATHLPPANMPNLGPRGADKVAHFVAYGGLAFLMSGWLFTCNWSVARTAAVVLTVMTTYAVADELLQIGVGRNAEVLDWCADTLGAIGGVGAATLVLHFVPPNWLGRSVD